MLQSVWRMTLLIAGMLLVMGSGPARASDEIVARFGADETRVSAFGAWVVWSVPVEGGRRWRLMARHAGRTFSLGDVPPRRRSPFDVDLGPGPDGRPAAVYSRGGRAWMRPLVPGGHERPLYVALPDGARVAWPTIWRDRIAYVVRHIRGPDALMAGPVAGRQARVRRGPLTALDSIRPRRTPARALQLDLRGDRLAFTWSRGGDGGSEIYIASGRRGLRKLDAGFGDAGGEGVDFLGAPILQAGLVRWTEIYDVEFGPEPVCLCLVTVDLRSRVRTRTPLPAGRTPFGVAADARHLYVWNDGIEIRRLGRAAFPVDALPSAAPSP